MKIVVVFKTHFDIGYTDLSVNVLEKYRNKMLGDVVDACEKTQGYGPGGEYVWTMSAWPLKVVLDEREGLTPLQRRADGLVRRGQLRWHGLPFTTHTEFCGLEEFIRGLYFSHELSGRYGFTPVSAKMTDVPGHTRILPSVLAGAGISFLHLGGNSGCTAPDVPPLFWWEAPDGQRVLTFYSKGGYGTAPTPPAEWPYDVWLAMQMTNDNLGPQSPEVIESLREKIRRQIPDADIQIGTMDDFYREIIKSPLDIPTIREDLADTWIHGAGTYPAETSLLRRTRRRLTEAEALLTCRLTERPGEIRTAAAAVAGAYESLILFDEHTWGLNGQLNMAEISFFDKEEFLAAKSIGAYNRMEASWQEQRDRAHAAADLTEQAERAAWDGLEASPETAAGYRLFAGDGLLQGRWVDLEGYTGGGAADARTGEALPLRRFAGRTQAYVERLPAVGTVFLRKTDRPGPPPPAPVRWEDGETEAVIRNRYYTIRVSKATGLMTSLYDAEHGHEWIDGGNPDGAFSYRYDRYGTEDITRFIKTYAYRFFDWLLCDIGRRFYPECARRVYHGEPVSVTAAADGDAAVIRVERKGDEKAVRRYGEAVKTVMEIRLLPGDRAIRVGLDVLDKQETLYIDAGHLVMPFRLERGTVTVNKLGGLVDIARDIVDDGNHALYCMENYIDVSNGTFGMTVVSHDAPLCSVGREDLLTFRRQYAPGPPHLYFNLFNNTWGTNFPLYIGGSFHYDFTLFTHDGPVGEASQQAELLALGRQSARPSPPAEYDARVGFSEPLRILAFKPALGGEPGTAALRVKEHEGRAKTVRCRVAGAVRHAACDLLERGGEWRDGGRVLRREGEVRENASVPVLSEAGELQAAARKERIPVHPHRLGDQVHPPAGGPGGLGGLPDRDEGRRRLCGQRRQGAVFFPGAAPDGSAGRGGMEHPVRAARHPASHRRPAGRRRLPEGGYPAPAGRDGMRGGGAVRALGGNPHRSGYPAGAV